MVVSLNKIIKKLHYFLPLKHFSLIKLLFVIVFLFSFTHQYVFNYLKHPVDYDLLRLAFVQTIDKLLNSLDENSRFQSLHQMVKE